MMAPTPGSDAAEFSAGADRNTPAVGTQTSRPSPGTTSEGQARTQQTRPIAIETTNLSVAYRSEPVLRNVSLQVPAGVVMGIVGPNGAGKSTLIKAMLDLVTPLTGQVRFFGAELNSVRQRVGYMPQTASVDWDFPATVSEVVMMGTYGRLGWLRRPGSEQRAEVSRALEQTGMEQFASRQIGELSGGQRQRVFLARALVQAPDVYLMDEPFQGVDALSQRAIIKVLHGLRSAGRTVIVVHHDLATVADFCDQVTLLNERVIASGPVEKIFTDAAILRTYVQPVTPASDRDHPDVEQP